MFTVLTNTRNSNLYLLIAMAIAVVILVFGVAPSIAAPRPAIIPATGSQNTYVEFLRGEKAISANPVGLSEALSAYHLGEKAIYGSAVNSSNALSAWRFGEKTLYANVDLSWPPRPDFSHLREKNVAPASYRSPTDECFDVPLREVAQCRTESGTPSQ